LTPGFAIITCAYNPDPKIFQRLLDAIDRVIGKAVGIFCEVIIVDNNSRPALSENELVRAFLQKHATAKLILETQPGLTSARIAGAKRAGSEWLVFFDDDNEPAADYLEKAASVIADHPEAGIMGPGNISVEFTGPVSAFAVSHRDLFQERVMTETVFDNVRWGQTAYPYGTGMVVRKLIMEKYINLVAAGKYTMTDRVGKSLISGGDMQILLTGIKMGYFGGSSHELKLNHLIKQEKTRYKKMLQLVFMLSASAIKLYNEVFPDQPHNVVKITNRYVLQTLYTQCRLHLFKKPFREAVYLLSTRMGELYAHVIAAGTSNAPFLLRFFYKVIS